MFMNIEKCQDFKFEGENLLKIHEAELATLH
jgi:hypothetical protein